MNRQVQASLRQPGPQKGRVSVAEIMAILEKAVMKVHEYAEGRAHHPTQPPPPQSPIQNLDPLKHKRDNARVGYRINTETGFLE